MWYMWHYRIFLWNACFIPPPPPHPHPHTQRLVLRVCCYTLKPAFWTDGQNFGQAGRLPIRFENHCTQAHCLLFFSSECSFLLCAPLHWFREINLTLVRFTNPFDKMGDKFFLCCRKWWGQGMTGYWEQLILVFYLHYLFAHVREKDQRGGGET